MGFVYTKKKDESEDAIDFMKVMEAQQATLQSMLGETVAQRPYDVEKKTQVGKQIEVEQRPKED